MAKIPSGLNLFVFSASIPVDIASAAWKNKVKVIYTLNPSATGWLSFTPTSSFPTLTQLVKDKFYLIDSDVEFDLPNAQLGSLPGLEDGAPTDPLFYKDKKLLVLADSFGDGPFYLFHPIAASLQMKLVIDTVPGRCATGGTGNIVGDGNYRRPGVEALPDLLAANTDAEILILEPMINDFNYRTPIGTADSTDVTTLAGSYNKMITDAKAALPKARIIVIIGAVRGDGGNDNTTAQKPYMDIVKEICQNRSIEFVDQWNNPDLTFAKLPLNATDWVHFNTEVGVAAWNAPIINKIIKRTSLTVVSLEAIDTTHIRVSLNGSVRNISLSGLKLTQNGVAVNLSSVSPVASSRDTVRLKTFDITTAAFASGTVLQFTAANAGLLDFVGNTMNTYSGPVINNIKDNGGPVDYSKHMVRDMVWDGVNFIASGRGTGGSVGNVYIAPGSDGVLTKLDSFVTGDNGMMGLTTTLLTDSGYIYDQVDFLFYFNGSILRIFEKGINRYEVTLTSEPKLQVAKEGTSLKYYVNDQVVRTVTIPANTKLIPAVCFFGSMGQMKTYLSGTNIQQE